MEALRNQQSLFERRFEQHNRVIGSLDSGEAYAPSLLKTRLLDLLIAVFNLLVLLLSAVFQLGLRLANLSHLLRQHPVPTLMAGLALLLVVALLVRWLSFTIGWRLTVIYEARVSIVGKGLLL